MDSPINGESSATSGEETRVSNSINSDRVTAPHKQAGRYDRSGGDASSAFAPYDVRRHRARLASFDDDTIPAVMTSFSDGAGAQEFNLPASNRPTDDDYEDVNRISSAAPSFKQHADGVKIIELKSPDSMDETKVALLIVKEDAPEGGRSPGARLDRPELALTEVPSDRNEWSAPFSDLDDLESEGDKGQVTPVDDVEKAIESPKTEKCSHNEPFLSTMSPAQRLMGAAIKVHAVVKFTRMQRIKKRARWLTKKFIVFVLSHVGLTSLVGLYAVAGGFIFQHLELQSRFDYDTNETETYPDTDLAAIAAFREEHIERMWNSTLEMNILYVDLWKEKANENLKEFEQKIIKTVRKGKEVANDSKSEEADEWTYPSALLFAITIITTIGYGDIVPQTPAGMVVSMLYALFGIPLTLLCLANIGSFLATVYRFTWKHASYLALVIVRSPDRDKELVATRDVRVPITVSVTTMVVYILIGAAIFSKWENWTFLEGSYFCFITLSTIGFGDYVPGQDTETLDHNAKRVVCALYLLFGLALLSMIFQLIQDSVRIVVSRYASFLGLSKAQIEKDIEESDEDDDESKMTRKIAIANSTFANSGILEDDEKAKETRRQFRELAAKSGKLHRAQTVPTRTPHIDATRPHVVRLCSVPEEQLHRTGSSHVELDVANNGTEHPQESGLDMEAIKDILCRKYTITDKSPTNEAAEKLPE